MKNAGLLVMVIGLASVASTANAGWFDFLKSEPKKKEMTADEKNGIVFGYCLCGFAAKIGIFGAGGSYEAMTKPTAKEVEKAFRKENAFLSDPNPENWNCGQAQEYLNAAGRHTHGNVWYARRICFNTYKTYGKDEKLREKSQMMFLETKRREPVY